MSNKTNKYIDYPRVLLNIYELENKKTEIKGARPLQL